MESKQIMQAYHYLPPMEFKYRRLIVDTKQKYEEIDPVTKKKTIKERIVKKEVMETTADLWNRINEKIRSMDNPKIYQVETLYKQYSSKHVSNCEDPSTETVILGYRIFARNNLMTL